MLTRLGRRARGWLEGVEPWTNVYGLARSMLAAATAATLATSHSTALFRPAAGLPPAPYCDGLTRFGPFCLVPSQQLELARWAAVLALLVVASGWRPRLTGPLHWWVCFSFQGSAITLDGGDHVATNLSLLLLPVTLTDPRRWHWARLAAGSEGDERAVPRLTAASALVAVRVQVAVIYFQAGVAKMAVEEWSNGTALYYWFTHPNFGAPEWLLALLKPLLTNGLTVSLMTWGVIIFEIVLFMALVMGRRAWRPLLLLGLGFHAGIALIHGLVSFALTMMAALVLYLRPTDQELVVGRWRRSPLGREREPVAGTSQPELQTAPNVG